MSYQRFKEETLKANGLDAATGFDGDQEQIFVDGYITSLECRVQELEADTTNSLVDDFLDSDGVKEI